MSLLTPGGLRRIDAPTFVKNAGTGTAAASVNGITFSVTTAVPAGAFAIVRVGWGSQAIAIQSITDSQSNTYTVDSYDAAGNAGLCGVGIASGLLAHALSTSDTVTCTLAATTARMCASLEWFVCPGIVATDVVQANGGTTSAGATSASDSITTNVVTDLLIGNFTCKGSSSASYTEDSNWSTLGGLTNGATSSMKMGGAYRFVTSAGSYTYAPSWSDGTFGYVEVIASYQVPHLVRPAILNQAIRSGLI